MTTTDQRITTIARIVGKLERNPFVPREAEDAMHMLILILGELDDRLTKLERSNDGNGRKAR